MATRDIYEMAFDEDVQRESSSNRCPECDGRVRTNVMETVCEDYSLVIMGKSTTAPSGGPTTRVIANGQVPRSRRPFTTEAYRPKSVAEPMGETTNSLGGNDVSSPGYDVNIVVDGSSRKPSEISYTDWVKLEEYERPRTLGVGS